MNQNQAGVWFSVISLIMVGWGIVFTIFGLDVLPVVDMTVLLPWESALYGAIMIGWATTLFLVGRIAFRRDDKELMTAVLIGLGLWLVVEAARSALLGVWFNVGVDVCVLLLFAAPLVMTLRQHQSRGQS